MYPTLIVSIIVLIACSAFFSASETAYSSINRIRLKHAAEQGDKKAARTLRIADGFDKTLSTILIGNNIVNIASASLGTILFTDLFGAAGAGISTLVMTVVVLIFGEILPKTFAKERSETVALGVAVPLRGLIIIFTPLTAFFTWLKRGFMSLFRSDGKAVSVTEEELKYIIEEIEDEGVLEKQESELVQSALDFDETTVDEILTPRVDLASFEAGTPVEEIRDLYLKTPYSRIPVYEKSVDNIIGVLHSRDFFVAYITDKENIEVRAMLQSVIFVPPKKRISELLTELQKLKSHIAVVTDQFGGVMGIVTLEDILEELVGEIWDEYDDVEIAITELGEGKYEANGDIHIDDLFEAMGIDLPKGFSESHTLSSWVLEALGRIPVVGDSFEAESLRITVKEMDDQRIVTVLLEILPTEPAEDDSEA